MARVKRANRVPRGKRPARFTASDATIEAIKSIEAALRELPHADSAPENRIPYVELSGAIAHELFMTAGQPAKGLPAKQITDLEGKVATIRSLAREIYDYRPDNVLEDQVDEGSDLLRALPHEWRVAIITIASWDPPKLSKANPGNPGKAVAAKIADRVAEEYSRIVGKEPPLPSTPSQGGKASGPFLELLAKIYLALGVAASPESQAREAIARRRSNI